MLRDAVITELQRVLGPEAEGLLLHRFLSTPKNPEHGDLAFGCFALLKEKIKDKGARREAQVRVAKNLAERIQASGLIGGAMALDGYVNFRAHPERLLEHVAHAVADGSLMSAGQDAPSVMVEFSQPNTHKFFHVGHLRNVAIGDSLVQILRAAGHRVVAANYYGDFGIDVAKCLWWLRTHPELVAPETDRTTFLGTAYTAANDVLDKKRIAALPDGPEKVEAGALREQALTEVRAVLSGMESGDPEVSALYEQTRQWCLHEFGETYRWLGVAFDVDFFESRVETAANAIVEHFIEEGVFAESEGAIVCDLLPDMETPAMVRKTDGTSLYMTWDLALAREKFEQHDIELSYYVVGAEQRFHFKQLFLTLQRMGYDRAKDCRHVAYELVRLPEGKMSSRDGSAVPLHTLRDAVTEMLNDRLEEAEANGRTRVDPSSRARVLRCLAVASLKYGMLSTGTNRQVVFNVDDWTNPLGNTGVYLLYAIARMRSILRKGGAVPDLAALDVTDSGFGSPAEHALLNHVLNYTDTVKRAAERLDPSVIAGWGYECARAYNQFHRQCQVNTAVGPLREARRALVAVTDEVLSNAVRLLGIEPVDRM